MSPEEKAAIHEWFDLATQALSEAEDLTIEEMEEKRQEWIIQYKNLMSKIKNPSEAF